MEITATFTVNLPDNTAQTEIQEKLETIADLCGMQLIKWSDQDVQRLLRRRILNMETSKLKR